MRKKIYFKDGFKVFEVLDNSIDSHSYHGHHHIAYYTVETPDLEIFRFHYYKDAMKFIEDVSIAYQPYCLTTREGVEEFNHELKEVYHIIRELYNSGRCDSYDTAPLSYRTTAKIHRIINTLIRDDCKFIRLEDIEEEK